MKLKPAAHDTLLHIYRSKPRSDGRQRTIAIANTFMQALSDAALSTYRPDELWTDLNSVYVEIEAEDSLTKYLSHAISAVQLLEALHSVQNGWVKSSGTAFEYFLATHYGTVFHRLVSPSPQIRLLLKSDPELRKLRPTNLPAGSSTIDDLYLLVKNGPAWMIFAMVSAQASGGDRWLRGEQRCNALRTSGINCINITLDPRDISRSPNGNLCQPDYLTRFQSANPSYNAHFVVDVHDQVIAIPTSVTVSRSRHSLHQPSRLFRSDARNANNFLIQKAITAANAFVSNGNTLPSTHHW